LPYYCLACCGDPDPRDALDRWNVAQGDWFKMGDEIRAPKLKYYAMYCIPIPQIFEPPAV